MGGPEMNAREYAHRVSRAWQSLQEAQEARRRIDDGAAEHGVEYAGENLRRALFGQRPIPPEAREAQRRLDDYFDDHSEKIRAGEPAHTAHYFELMGRVSEIECAAGIHESCRHAGPGARRRAAAEKRDDFLQDQRTTGDWYDQRNATVWGVINPDGTVNAKGFDGDDTADDDKRVHSPGSIAYYHPGDKEWVNAATGHPASEGPTRPPTPPPRQPAAAVTTGGTDMSSPQRSTGPTGGSGAAAGGSSPGGSSSGGGGGPSLGSVKGVMSKAEQKEKEATRLAHEGKKQSEQAAANFEKAKQSAAEAKRLFLSAAKGTNNREAEQRAAEAHKAEEAMTAAAKQAHQASQTSDQAHKSGHVAGEGIAGFHPKL